MIILIFKIQIKLFKIIIWINKKFPNNKNIYKIYSNNNKIIKNLFYYKKEKLEVIIFYKINNNYKNINKKI